MGYMCDFCGEQRSFVYCRSDAACLCLSCDRNIHSANALSKRHSRTLMCERCNSQPAFVRCVEESVSLCQSCNFLGHNTSASATHKRQTISCYSGCPTASQLSSIWSFVLDLPAEPACGQGLVMMSVSDKDDYICQNCNTLEASGVLQSSNNSERLVGMSSIDYRNSEPSGLAQLNRSRNLISARASHPRTNSVELSDDGFYRDLDMDELDLSIENYEELFGVSVNPSEELLENGGIESLFAMEDMVGTGSNCQDVIGAEGSSIGLVNAVQPACSNAASADSVMSSKTEPIICFTPEQAPSNLSFSGLSGENNSAGDHQDCGASPAHLLGEPPWCSPLPEGSVQSANRSNAVMRYREKKKTRKFDKRVRYESRKARADVRKRVKGRFVKAGEAYDYDPLSPTRSY